VTDAAGQQSFRDTDPLTQSPQTVSLVLLSASIAQDVFLECAATPAIVNNRGRVAQGCKKPQRGRSEGKYEPAQPSIP